MFVTGGVEIKSSEGTTQGCPYSMPAYALAILPLMSMINSYHNGTTVKHSAFADDLCGAGQLSNLKIWWDMVNDYGPHLGYFAEPTKSWLLAQHQWTKKATRRQSAWPPKQSLAKLATTLPTLAATSQKTT